MAGFVPENQMWHTNDGYKLLVSFNKLRAADAHENNVYRIMNDNPYKGPWHKKPEKQDVLQLSTAEIIPEPVAEKQGFKKRLTAWFLKAAVVSAPLALTACVTPRTVVDNDRCVIEKVTGLSEKQANTINALQSVTALVGLHLPNPPRMSVVGRQYNGLCGTARLMGSFINSTASNPADKMISEMIVAASLDDIKVQNAAAGEETEKMVLRFAPQADFGVARRNLNAARSSDQKYCVAATAADGSFRSLCVS